MWRLENQVCRNRPLDPNGNGYTSGSLVDFVDAEATRDFQAPDSASFSLATWRFYQTGTPCSDAARLPEVTSSGASTASLVRTFSKA